MTILLIVLVAACVVILGTEIAVVVDLLRRPTKPTPPTPSETKAALLLHKARRERQLAELQQHLQARTEAQIRRWENGDWSENAD